MAYYFHSLLTIFAHVRKLIVHRYIEKRFYERYEGALDLLFFITLPQVPFSFICADNWMRIAIEKTLKLLLCFETLLRSIEKWFRNFT